jgi:hypothetical protein
MGEQIHPLPYRDQPRMIEKKLKKVVSLKSYDMAMKGAIKQ